MSTGKSGERSVVVRFENVSKRFRRHDSPPFLLRGIFGKRSKPGELWLMRDMSFEVCAGETVGIMGVNGVGKSTLLRLIAGSCAPTSGQVAVRGRIAPLLSLGVGFHPDMTGRECVWMNAAVLGLTRRETADRFASMVEFAEIEDRIDTPMRHYSSGMQARLGFSVAVHTSPDVLLIDELLAVGDQRFREKCITRLKKMSADGGTIIVVSHAAESVRALCSRTIWLQEGCISRDGPTAEIVDAYLAAAELV